MLKNHRWMVRHPDEDHAVWAFKHVRVLLGCETIVTNAAGDFTLTLKIEDAPTGRFITTGCGSQAHMRPQEVLEIRGTVGKPYRMIVEEVLNSGRVAVISLPCPVL